MDPALSNAFEEALWRHLKAERDHPGVYVGPQPKAEDFHFSTAQDIWLANEIERRVKREFSRTA